MNKMAKKSNMQLFQTRDKHVIQPLKKLNKRKKKGGKFRFNNGY